MGQSGKPLWADVEQGWNELGSKPGKMDKQAKFWRWSELCWQQSAVLKNNLGPVHVFTSLETQHSYALSLMKIVMDSLLKYK